MARFRISLISLLLLVCCHSCWLENPDMEHFVPSYVIEYQVNPSDVLLDVRNRDICLSLLFEKSVGCLSTGGDYDQYEALCEENGDTDYNRLVWFFEGVPRPGEVATSFSPDLVSVNVTSDQEFDALHPVGTSLNDCIQIKYASILPYIVSGYDRAQRPIVKVQNLGEVKPVDLRLLQKLKTDGCFLRLSFHKLPDESSVHTLTISVVFANNQEYKCTIDYEF